MSHTWKLLPLAAVFALGLVMLVPGTISHPTQPQTASAACTNSTGRLQITITDNNTDNFIPVVGSRIRISPNPDTDTSSETVTDGTAPDVNAATGVIRLEGMCVEETYNVQLLSLPSPYTNCDYVNDSDSIDLTNASLRTLDLTVDCSNVNITPTATVTTTATPTTTVGPASGLTISASPATLGCNGTSIITVQVKDASGNAVAAGTAVTLTASQGSVSPTSGTTASDGSLFVFYSATGNANGAVTVGATAGSATGNVTVTVNCSAVPTSTTAPPPTVAPTVSGGGVISPPNTGSAGLAKSDNGIGWQTYGGIVLVIASALGALVLVRSRVRD